MLRWFTDCMQVGGPGIHLQLQPDLSVECEYQCDQMEKGHALSPRSLNLSGTDPALGRDELHWGYLAVRHLLLPVQIHNSVNFLLSRGCHRYCQ